MGMYLCVGGCLILGIAMFIATAIVVSALIVSGRVSEAERYRE